MIRLTPYRPEHRQALEHLQLPAEQAEFTALPRDLLPAVLADPDSLAVTILEDEVPVGLFALSVGENRDKYLPQPDPAGVALRALSVDISTQGRGIGTGAMQLLTDFVPQHFPQARHVLLVVNQRNPRAKRVYEKVGFSVIAERQGQKGPQWIMRLPLAEA